MSDLSGNIRTDGNGMANERLLESEYEQRLANVRREVNASKLDALIVFSQKRSHVRYLSGYHPNYHTHSALLLLPLKQDPILWIKFGFDLARAKAASWIKDIRVAERETNNSLVTGCAKAVRDLNLEKARIGIVASDMAVDELSVSLRDCLGTELPNVEFELACDLLNSIRAVKSPAEVKYLRDAAQVADAVADGLRAAIKPGSSDLQAVVAGRAGRPIPRCALRHHHFHGPGPTRFSSKQLDFSGQEYSHLRNYGPTEWVLGTNVPDLFGGQTVCCAEGALFGCPEVL